MIRIHAVNGIYELERDSNGTYHEIVAKLSNTLLLAQLKRMLRWAR